jgi:hypothetical protein
MYEAGTPGCEVLNNASWKIMDSSPQPDFQAVGERNRWFIALLAERVFE